MKTYKKYYFILTAVILLSLLLAGSAVAKSSGKVEICHRTGNGGFVLININSNALQAHLAHGDVAPGAAVPGQPGKSLGADCSLSSTAHTEPDESLPSTSNNGKKAEKVDVCHKRGNGTFIMINVDRNALPAHLLHGDGLPNGGVPNQPGKYFTTNCSISDVPKEQLVDTLTILPTGASFDSKVLEGGQLYELRASGTYTYNYPSNGWADAEYYLKNGVVVKGDTEGSTPYVLDLSINGYSSNTDWGAYEPMHEYTKQWTGTGASLSFSIYDSNYKDNRGSLTLEIWKINW
jgi:hypothetical protein